MKSLCSTLSVALLGLVNRSYVTCASNRVYPARPPCLSSLQLVSKQVLQATTDFVDWLNVSTNRTTAAGILEIIDSEAVRYPYRFYRTKTAE